MNNSKIRKSQELSVKEVNINDAFWNKLLEMNNNKAIFYQWNQLEKTHNQDNFRVLAGEKEGYRFGFFYCDSDLHKWTDAAARILIISKNDKLSRLIHEYIDLMQKVQSDDGYLFTYNQFHFPKRRWANLQIEHELYCLGHLIEAAVSFMETDEPDEYKSKFLSIAIKAADLLVQVFLETSAKYTPGHQEIEIALIRLYRLTREKKYLDLASHFIYQRGKDSFFGLKLIKQARDQGKRKKLIDEDMKNKEITSPIGTGINLGEMKNKKEPAFLGLRSNFQFLTGRYHQQNSPVEKMKRPFGHAVRWGYLVTAMAMLYQENGDEKLLKALFRTWDHLIQKQMFVTGGIGALGHVEGFGRDYELKSEYSYCETCAAIANILFNWELAKITNEAKYSDLLEWQFYNALSVGIGLEGNSYLYRNLLESEGNLTRESWFATPCCPSNISRIWASIGKYVYSYNSEEIFVHQFIGSSIEISTETLKQIKIKMDSTFPWNGKVKIVISVSEPYRFKLKIRIPSWTENPKIKINDEDEDINFNPQPISTGSGFSPYNSIFHSISREWVNSTTIELDFPMPIKILRANPKVKSNRNKIALSKGPLVYCFESPDNPIIRIPNATIDLSKEITSEFDSQIFGGIIKLSAFDKQGQSLVAIPYYCWANREPSAMQIWIAN
ncbi:MAG: glycoside hydrolase family 127 protein [Candidatus Heimdallarchaeota archaeon]|nr:glycoside hydrolase family 127 protein [Candidatus Heimdallarchaeota archaeon]